MAVICIDYRERDREAGKQTHGQTKKRTDKSRNLIRREENAINEKIVL